MKRGALLVSLAALAGSLTLASAATVSSEPFHPFGPKANSVALKERIVEEFPDAQFPAREDTVCSSAEHSPDGPTSYCFVEFVTGSTWNLDEVAMTIDLVGGTGISIGIYSHTTWQRKWRECGLRPRVPGRLFSNDNCGLGQPEQFSVQTDGDMVDFDVWPRIRSHKQLRFVARDFIYSDVVPFLAHYRASHANGAYIFTNAVGDSFRYRP